MSERDETGRRTHAADDRMAALEAKVDAHHNSLATRLSLLAGITAFVISMFNIFDRLVTQPNAEKASEYQQFKSDIRAIAQANEDLAEKSGDAKAASALGGPAAVIIQSYRDDAAHMLGLLGAATRDRGSRYFVGPYEYTMLATAAYGGGATRQALDFDDRAVDAADTPYARAEALKVKAGMLMQVKGAAALPEARQALKIAYDGLNGEITAGVPLERAQLVSFQAAIEAGAGDCADAAASAARAVQIATGSDAVPAVKPMVLGPLAGALKMQTRCPYGGFPEDLRAALEGNAPAAAEPQAASPAPAAAEEPAAVPPGYSLTCRLMQGPRAGQSQSYAGVPGVRPVPVGAPCQDGQGSYGMAE
jgi:hypothetical protein